MRNYPTSGSRFRRGGFRWSVLAIALLLLALSLWLVAWPARARAALPTPTPTPGGLQLRTPTPDRRLTPAAGTPAAARKTPAPPVTPPPVRATSVPGAVTISVDTTERFQRIDGFGATHLSLVYEGGGGDVLGPALRAEAIDAVYSEVGINLGNLEDAVLESPGSYDQRANDNDDPGLINWSGFQVAGAETMRPALLDQARPLGFTGPFPGQKINVRWASPWLGDLRSVDYDRYLDEAAEQVEAGAFAWQALDSSNAAPSLLMLFNEPLSGNGELAGGSTQEVVDLVKVAAARLRAAGLGGVRFVVPNEETVTKTLETAGALLADPAARAALGAIGYHSYPYGSAYASIPRILAAAGHGEPDPAAVAERQKLASLAQAAGLPLWMTEVSHGEVDPLSFDALRGRAIHIHDELLYAGASAYFGMNNMWDSASQRMHFGNEDLFDPSNEGNIVLIDSDAGKVYITGIGYAIGHYARWAQPGAVRVASSSSDPLVKVTALQNSREGGSTLVLVVINNAATSRTLQIDVMGMALGGTLRGEQSTSAAAWQPLKGATRVSPSQVQLAVPAYSVTTLSVGPQ